MRPRLATHLAVWSLAHPRLVVSLTILALLGALWRIPALQIQTSNLDLIDPDLPEVSRFLSFAREYGTLNPLVVVLETTSPPEAEQLLDQLEPLLAGAPGVASVVARLPYPLDFLKEYDIDPYLCTLDHGMYFVLVQPEDYRSGTANLTPMVAEIEKIIQAAPYNRNHIKVGLTGIPKYALDDQQIIQRDISKYSGIALILIGLLFYLGFRHSRDVFAVLATLLISLVVTLGLAAVFPGYLTMLSALFASLLLGLGIDYGIHIVLRLEQFVASGSKNPVLDTMTALAGPLQTAWLTTVGVFLLLRLSDFKGFAQLGFLAAIGLSVCFLMMYSLLPVVLAWMPRHPAKPARKTPWVVGFLRLLQHPLSKTVFVLITLAALFTGMPEFDSNYLNLQPQHSQAVRLQKRMLEDSDFAPDFAVFRVPDAAGAAALAQRLREEPTVGAVRSLTDLDEISDGQAPEPPESFRRLFVHQGTYAVYAYPMDDVWEHSEGFINAMTAIDPEVTGMPFLGEFMMKRSFRALTVTLPAALVLLLLVTAWDFRKPKAVAAALIGPVLTLVWMGAAMIWLGLSFDPLNMMALPLVLGIAVDDAVHMLHGLETSPNLDTTWHQAGGGVLLTTLTTLAAFGSLLATDHRGLYSFCLTATLGVAAAFFNAVILVPWLHALQTKRKAP